MKSISSKELARLLSSKGYKVLGSRSSYLVLRKGATQIIIPNEERLAPNIIHTILEQAHLSSDDLHETSPPTNTKINKEHQVVYTSSPRRKPKMSFFRTALDAESKIFSLGLYRIAIGVLFLLSAFSKAPWNDFGWFGVAVQNAIDYPTFGFIASFMQNTVQPNLAVFGWIQFVLELLIGLSLILGLFVVGSAFFAQFWVLLIWMIAASWPTEWAWSYIMLLFSMILFWTIKAGRSLGIDQTLLDKAEAYAEHSTVWALIRWLV